MPRPIFSPERDHTGALVTRCMRCAAQGLSRKEVRQPLPEGWSALVWLRATVLTHLKLRQGHGCLCAVCLVDFQKWVLSPPPRAARKGEQLSFGDRA
jgi:hypothetical protein